MYGTAVIPKESPEKDLVLPQKWETHSKVPLRNLLTSPRPPSAEEKIIIFSKKGIDKFQGIAYNISNANACVIFSSPSRKRLHNQKEETDETANHD